MGETVERDESVIARCLAGDQAAWTELYHLCHRRLLAVAHETLGALDNRRDASEEVAARVWMQLVNSDFSLLRAYDSTRNCRFTTYITAICRHQALNYQKSQRRRRMHEVSVEKVDALDPSFAGPASPEVNWLPSDFLDLLTSRERSFCAVYLMSATSGEHHELKLSQCNIRQLRRRVRQKLVEFLNRV